MLAKLKIENQSSLFFTLEDTFNKKHLLYILSNKINWSLFEKEFSITEPCEALSLFFFVNALVIRNRVDF